MDALPSALKSFQDSLTPSQKAELLLLSTCPDTTAVLTFTAELDFKNSTRKSRGVASRLVDFLQSVQQFISVVDTFMQAKQGIGSLVWGSIKLTMLAATNFSSYFDKLSECFMRLRKDCPRLSEYHILYRDSPRLQKALSQFYATVIRFCQHTIRITQRKGFEHAAKAFLKPYELEFGPLESQLQRENKEVEAEISLAAKQAAEHERRRQASHRDWSISVWQKSVSDSKRRDEERRLIKQKSRFLRKLSTHDHLVALKRARKIRHGATSTWLSRSDEYASWLKEPEPSLFWCSGILGSGKTVCAASVIDDLLRRRTKNDAVSFFFCCYDDEQSLKAKNILGSLVRQGLEANPSLLSSDDVSQLLEEDKCDVECLVSLLVKVCSSSGRQYTVIDGLDECDKVDVNAVLDALRTIFLRTSSNVKIFLASRTSLSTHLETRFNSFYHRSMRTAEVDRDIESYVEETLTKGLEQNHLKVGNPDLILEIRNALVKNARGMFLLVTFQLQEIFDQDTDEAIREIIRNLPKDLEETFCRILEKIIKARKSKMVERIFSWIIAAKRPLSIEEMHEAVAIEPGQQYMDASRLLNDTSQMIIACGNLVIIDEENLCLQFAHHSVKQFLISGPSVSALKTFRLSMEQADFYLGEICVTYLCFSDFERRLVKSVQLDMSLKPDDIVKTSLSSTPNSKFATSALAIYRRKRSSIGNESFGKVLADTANDLSMTKNLSLKYPLLTYVREYWLAHTKGFGLFRSRESHVSTWNLWERLLCSDLSIAEKPWTATEWTKRAELVLEWIIEFEHSALLVRWCLGTLDYARFTTALNEYGRLKWPMSKFLCTTILLFWDSEIKGSIRVEIQSIIDDYVVLSILAAADNRHFETMEAIIESLPENTTSHQLRGKAFRSASASGRHGLVHYVLEYLVPQDEIHLTPEPVTWLTPDKDGNNAAHLAALYGHVDVLTVMHQLEYLDRCLGKRNVENQTFLDLVDASARIDPRMRAWQVKNCVIKKGSQRVLSATAATREEMEASFSEDYRRFLGTIVDVEL